jgi:hypothetical protein
MSTDAPNEETLQALHDLETGHNVTTHTLAEFLEALEDIKAAEAYKAKGANQKLISLDIIKQELGL